MNSRTHKLNAGNPADLALEVWFKYYKNPDTNSRLQSVSPPDQVGIEIQRPYCMVSIKFRNGDSATGIARCSPDDQFCAQKGLQLALKRALLKKPMSIMQMFTEMSGSKEEPRPEEEVAAVKGWRKML